MGLVGRRRNDNTLRSLVDAIGSFGHERERRRSWQVSDSPYVRRGPPTGRPGLLKTSPRPGAATGTGKPPPFRPRVSSPGTPLGRIRGWVDSVLDVIGARTGSGRSPAGPGPAPCRPRRTAASSCPTSSTRASAPPALRPRTSTAMRPWRTTEWVSLCLHLFVDWSELIGPPRRGRSTNGGPASVQFCPAHLSKSGIIHFRAASAELGAVQGMIHWLGCFYLIFFKHVRLWLLSLTCVDVTKAPMEVLCFFSRNRIENSFNRPALPSILIESAFGIRYQVLSSHFTQFLFF